MKKIIIVAAFVLTAGIVATTNNVKSVKVVKAPTTTFDKNVIANAD